MLNHGEADEVPMPLVDLAMPAEYFPCLSPYAHDFCKYHLDHLYNHRLMGASEEGRVPTEAQFFKKNLAILALDSFIANIAKVDKRVNDNGLFDADFPFNESRDYIEMEDPEAQSFIFFEPARG